MSLELLKEKVEALTQKIQSSRLKNDHKHHYLKLIRQVKSTTHGYEIKKAKLAGKLEIIQQLAKQGVFKDADTIKTVEAMIKKMDLALEKAGLVEGSINNLNVLEESFKKDLKQLEESILQDQIVPHEVKNDKQTAPDGPRF